MAIAAAPGDADALASLAETWREHQDLAAARQVLDRLTELRPTALRTLRGRLMGTRILDRHGVGDVTALACWPLYKRTGASWTKSL